jgi:hypothetical protein
MFSATPNTASRVQVKPRNEFASAGIFRWHFEESICFGVVIDARQFMGVQRKDAKMNASAIPAAALPLCCAGISFALAASIYQPARRRAEIAALYFTLSTLGIWYLTRTLKSLGVWGEKGLLDQIDALAGTLLLAGGAAFLAATLFRLSGQRNEYHLQMTLIAIIATIAASAQFAEILALINHVTSLRTFWICYWIFAAIILLIGVRVLVLLAASRVTRREWWAFCTLICGALLALMLFPVLRTGAAGMAANLLPLAALTAFVYLRFRAVFLKIIIRRGVVVVGLFGSGWLFYHYLGGREDELPVGGLLFTLFWVTFNGPISRMVDRLLFGRPDHLRLARRLSIEMLSFVDRDEMIDHITSRLKGALKTEFVTWRTAEDRTAGSNEILLSIPVTSSGEVKGALQFGPRRLGEPYQRDDRRFLQSVAGQFAAVLENFALRDEQQARMQREHELREMATRAELQALRAQINPHFLFHALTLAASKTDTVPHQARALILNLLGMFRYVLNSTKRELVALGEELEFLTAYLEIERENLNGKVNYQIEVGDDLRAAQIPPMLLQPLVENAVRHGLRHKHEGGCVKISAERRADRILLQVADDGLGFDPASGLFRAPTDNGIGLTNVRERVEKLSGPDCWRLTSAKGAGTKVEIELRSAEC